MLVNVALAGSDCVQNLTNVGGEVRRQQDLITRLKEKVSAQEDQLTTHKHTFDEWTIKMVHVFRGMQGHL